MTFPAFRLPKQKGILVEEVPGFLGGPHLEADPNKIRPIDARRFLNMTLDEIGTATKRLGVSNINVVGGSSARVISAFIFEREGSTTQVIAHLDDGSLQYSTDLSSWTNIATGLSSSAPFTYVAFTDVVFMANGTDDFRSWSGSAQTTYASVPKFKYVATWKDTVWGAADSSNKHRVYSSAAGDGTSWPALNFVDVAKGQGPGITGLSSDASALVVFKHRSTHALYDPVEYTNRVVDKDKGCLSHFSIVNHNGAIYFVSHLGACLYLGDAPSRVVSTAIAPIFNDYIYDEAHELFIYGYSYQNRVGWSWPRDSTSDFNQMEFYPEYDEKPWVFHDMPVRVIVAVRESASIEAIYGFGEASNKTFRCYSSNTYTDDSVAFIGVIGSGWFDMQAPNLTKYIDRFLIQCRGDFTINIFIDFDPSAAAYSYAHSGADTLHEADISTDAYCRQFLVEFTDSSSGHTTRETPIGNEVESVNEGSFAVARFMALGKACGDYR